MNVLFTQVGGMGADYTVEEREASYCMFHYKQNNLCMESPSTLFLENNNT
jgi:hypothetical protein